jgi:hypothetical protein
MSDEPGPGAAGAGTEVNSRATCPYGVTTIIGLTLPSARRLSRNMALRELQQIAKQIAAAEMSSAIAETEPLNLQRQREQAAEVADFRYSKYTNQELYRWMTGQLSSLHLRMYQTRVSNGEAR